MLAEQAATKTYYEKVFADPAETIFWYGFGQGIMHFVGNINSALSAYLSDWFCHAWDFITGQYELVLHSEGEYVNGYSQDDIETMRRAGLTEEDIAEILGIEVAEDRSFVVEYTESRNTTQPTSDEKTSASESVVIPSNPDEKTRVDYELTYYVNDVNTENTQVLMEYGKRDELKSVYTYGNERISAETIADTYNPKTDAFETDYYLYDGRGSVTQVLNSSEIVESYTYDPFGNVTSGAPEFDSFYGYNAEDTNPVTGLQYLRARYYDTEDGRFSVADTYLGDVSEPLTLNRYAYTANNPMMQTDPSGHAAKWLQKAAKSVGNFVQKNAHHIGMAAAIVVTVAIVVTAPVSAPALAVAAVAAGAGLACIGVGGAVKANYEIKQNTKKKNKLDKQQAEIEEEISQIISNGQSINITQYKKYQSQLAEIKARRQKLCEEADKLKKQADIADNILYAAIGFAGMGLAPLAGPQIISALAGNSYVAGTTLVGGLTYGDAAGKALTAVGALGTTYAGSDIIEAATDVNPIKDTIYGGNDELYEEHQQTLNNINASTVIAGSLGALEKALQTPTQSTKYNHGNGSGAESGNSSGVTFKSQYEIPTNEKGYTKSSLELGKKVHKEYMSDVADDVNKIKEYVLPSGKRVDFIDFENKIVYELKPNNPNQISKGTKQLAGYLEEIETVFGKGWSSVLDTY